MASMSQLNDALVCACARGDASSATTLLMLGAGRGDGAACSLALAAASTGDAPSTKIVNMLLHFRASTLHDSRATIASQLVPAPAAAQAIYRMLQSDGVPPPDWPPASYSSASASSAFYDVLDNILRSCGQSHDRTTDQHLLDLAHAALETVLNRQYDVASIQRYAM